MQTGYVKPIGSMSTTDTSDGTRMLTVASVPAGHPYVDSVVDPARVRVLPDPIPTTATLPGQWWPPQLLDPAYVFRHVASFDVMHVHFGFEAFAVEALREVVAILRRNRVPLVLTVHDLHNPHFADPTLHLAQLDELVPAAAVVITLTDGAATAIKARWRVRPIVLAHPHVLPIDAVGAARRIRQVPVVAVHGKALRANIFPWPVLDALLDGELPDSELRFDLDAEGLDAMDSSTRLSEYREAGIDVRVHPRFTDPELVDYLADVDVAVLPYRFGTHSGWIEACYDAGTTVVAPDSGFFSEQHPGPVFGWPTEGLDAPGLRRAVALAIESLGLSRGEDVNRRTRRAAQRESVRDRMVELYHRALVSAAAA